MSLEEVLFRKANPLVSKTSKELHTMSNTLADFDITNKIE